MAMTQVPLNMLDESAGSLMFRNRIINGACLVAQRGAVAAANNTLVYGGCDRIGIAPVSFTTASGTIQQQNAGLGSMGYSQAITGFTSTGSGTLQFVQRIERRNTIDLNSNYVTISAKVYQNTGSALNISLQLNKASAADNFATNTQIAVSGNISIPSGTLTAVSFTIALGSSDASNGLQAMINFNVGAVTSKDFHVTDWQLEKGSVATPFEFRPIGTELALCQRYYEKSYDIGTAPATSTANGAFSFIAPIASSNHRVVIPFAVRKRATPSTQYWDLVGGASMQSTFIMSNNTQTNGVNSISSLQSYESNLWLNFATGVNAVSVAFHWAVSAEL